MMPELHKIKLHSQEGVGAAGSVGRRTKTRMKEHIELSKVHFTFQKLTCRTVKLQVCV